MSYSNLDPFHFNALLDDGAHQTARKICEAYPDADIEQVYRYAMARWVGNLYLRTRGFRVKPTDFQNAGSQSIAQIGCIEVERYGWVQFVPCGRLAESIALPSGKKENIKAYVPVEVDAGFGTLEELEEAVLLGFNRNFQAKVELDQLEDLQVFPEFLNNSITLPETSTVGEEIELTPPRTSLFPRITSGLRQLGEKLWPQDSTSDNSAINSVAYTPASAAVSPTESTKYDREIDLGESGTVLLRVHINDEYGGLSKVLVELKSLIDQGLPPRLELSIIGESDSRRRSTKENQRILQLNPYIKQPEENPLIQIVLGDRVCSFNLDELLIDESDITA